MNPLHRVLEQWRTDGISLLPPYTREQIVAIIGALGHEPSSDVIDLYRLTGGMEEDEWDSLFWSLWPIERVAAENKTYQGDGVQFADFLIDSHRYLFRHKDANASSVYVDYYDGEEPTRVAGSLHEFFEHYLNDPEKIYL
jgi:hypothetical protein